MHCTLHCWIPRSIIPFDFRPFSVFDRVVLLAQAVDPFYADTISLGTC